MHENLELNLLHEKPNVAVEDDVLNRSISKKMTLEEVCRYFLLHESIFKINNLSPRKALSITVTL